MGQVLLCVYYRLTYTRINRFTGYLFKKEEAFSVPLRLQIVYVMLIFPNEMNARSTFYFACIRL
jgi:hypothetical protein